jgi:hypothetical protein
MTTHPHPCSPSEPRHVATARGRETPARTRGTPRDTAGTPCARATRGGAPATPTGGTTRRRRRTPRRGANPRRRRFVAARAGTNPRCTCGRGTPAVRGPADARVQRDEARDGERAGGGDDAHVRARHAARASSSSKHSGEHRIPDVAFLVVLGFENSKHKREQLRAQEELREPRGGGLSLTPGGCQVGYVDRICKVDVR